MSNLLYIHIGNEIPECMYDSLYQTLLISHYKTRIYVIIDDSLIDNFEKRIGNFNLDIYTKISYDYINLINIIPISILDNELENDTNFNNYKNIITKKFKDMDQFRNGFWISTTSRFFYINSFMRLFKIQNVFHIENDIMLYESTDVLYNYICKYFDIKNIDKICMVQDAQDRVVPSILFFNDHYNVENLTKYIANTLEESNVFLNDMNILGLYSNKYSLPISPNDLEFTKNTEMIIFDGAAMGQYLGGIDIKNLGTLDKNTKMLYEFTRYSKGFVNETSIMKPNNYNFTKSKVISDHIKFPLNIPICINNGDTSLYKIANLHIHSKQLYHFSSIFNYSFEDIISGDRIISLCDFVLLTEDILNFHKNIQNFAKDILIIKDFDNIKKDLLNNYFKQHCIKNKTNVIKLFVYTHILKNFTEKILSELDPSYEYIIYVHNSDHTFDNTFNKLIESDIIKHVYTQNINIPINKKVSFLPIGIANSMWNHGNLLEFYEVLKNTYKNKKEKSIYVNINPSTYAYRSDILNNIKKNDNFTLSSGKPYKEYLEELSKHYFCLCVRGNGIDTHRMYESLYLGVIPVLINNSNTECNNFIEYIKSLDIPFYEITDEKDISLYNESDFNEKLYNRIISKLKFGIYNLQSLKLENYV